MSHETVEILRTLADQFNRGDFDDSLQFMGASVELHPGVLAPDQERRFVGHQGLIEWVRGATEPWKSVTRIDGFTDRSEALEAVGLGEDR